MSVSMSDFLSLEATRYLSGTAITLALYDHFLNLPKEIQYVWHQPPLFLAVCVLFDVYLREAGLLYFAVVMSGFAPLDKQGTTSQLSLRAANAEVVLAAEVQYAELHGIQAFIETCMFTKKSWYFVGSWAPMVAFDLIALALVAWSTLMTPRRQETAIVGILYKQGFYTFLAFLLLRLSRLLSSVFGSAADTTLMPPVTWALDGILSYRLFLTIKEMEYGSRRNWSKYDAGPRTRGNPQVGRQATTILVFEEIEMDSK
ncbi:hypothetical protein EVJ58_g8096 [Rhodofomes roseus]|uniref:DUF6533 domain-containing protein n=1 Tax=Rhodofomes roseus TaxID=34475 RepID=A0A4Y9Y1S7_9APHY|nr:hypothetical protein EVJ58_g8096 [Rhodofomes roseus]